MVSQLPCLGGALETLCSGLFVVYSHWRRGRSLLSPLLTFELEKRGGIIDLFSEDCYGNSLLAMWAYRELGLSVAGMYELGLSIAGMRTWDYRFNVMRDILKDVIT